MTPSPADAQILERILRDCGTMLLEALAAGGTAGKWSGAQFKAQADDLAHNFLVTALSEAFPGVPIVSEEGGANPVAGTADHFIIDPIDGTASFAHGFSGWVTQAAYVSEGRPIAAGIYAPISNEYFSALCNQGARCNGRHLSVNSTGAPAMRLIDNYPQPRGVARELMQALHIPEYVESGSIALKICRVADRSADLFVKDMSPRDWDVAAPMLVLTEAGGIITDIAGVPLQLGRSERRHQGLVAAANTAIAKQALTSLSSRK